MAAIAAGVGLLVVCGSSSAAAMMMGGKEKEDPVVATKDADSDDSDDDSDSGGSGTTTEPYADWRVEEGHDYPGNDIFHYWPGGDIKATKEVCLDKCEGMSNCKLVTFNNEKTLCWGKSTTGGRAHGDRNNYFKDGGDWVVEEGHDYPGNDIFHYWPGGDIKATKEVCLDKCEGMSNCKLVTFNNEKTLCWGKSTTGGRAHGDRNNYFKP